MEGSRSTKSQCKWKQRATIWHRSPWWPFLRLFSALLLSERHVSRPSGLSLSLSLCQSTLYNERLLLVCIRPYYRPLSCQVEMRAKKVRPMELFPCFIPPAVDVKLPRNSFNSKMIRREWRFFPDFIQKIPRVQVPIWNARQKVLTNRIAAFMARTTRTVKEVQCRRVDPIFTGRFIFKKCWHTAPLVSQMQMSRKLQ